MNVSFRGIGKREHARLVELGVGDRVRRNADGRWVTLEGDLISRGNRGGYRLTPEGRRIAEQNRALADVSGLR